mgnify:CR=1 FL=1
MTPGDRNRSLLYTSVSSGRMPYGRQPSKDEVERLGQWIDSLDDAKLSQVAAAAVNVERQRPILAWREFAQAAVRDVGEIKESDRAFARYFSYRNLFNGKLPCEDETAYKRRQELYEAGFKKLLNSVSRGTSLVIPTKVDGTKDLMVRVDIRDLGWDNDTWDKLRGRRSTMRCSTCRRTSASSRRRWASMSTTTSSVAASSAPRSLPDRRAYPTTTG